MQKNQAQSPGKKGSGPGRLRKMYEPSLRPGTRMGVHEWLGIKVPSTLELSDFDLIELGNAGITKASLDHLTAGIGMSRKYMAEHVLDISIKTLERKTASTRLDRKISAHALEIARLCAHGFDVFRDQEKLNQWLNRENRALNNRKPVELFGTLTGINLVNDLLTRIEEGVYS